MTFLSRTFSPYKKITAAIGLCVAALIALMLMTSAYAHIAGAQSATYEFAGYAWSSDIGWLSFSSINCDTDDNGVADSAAAGCPAVGTAIPKYRVSEDPATGALSGYAWSPNIGWITFDPAKTTGCPSGSCPATIDLSTRTASGWALACGSLVNKDACSGGTAIPDTVGGWDGWIHLSGTTSGGSYGVMQNSDCTLSGYAWGSYYNLGWIHTGDAGLTYGVRVASPASPSCAKNTCPAGSVGTYPSCTCPSGTTGTPPNCVPANTCPAGSVGTFPDCACPPGTVGTPPSCTNCGPGFTGVPPTCVPIVTGCPAGTSGTPPNCSTLNLSSSKPKVNIGDTVTLTWTVDNVLANSCKITNGAGWTYSISNGTTNSSGSVTTPPISRQANFILSCTGSDGNIYSKSIRVSLQMVEVEH